ncbi:hypothetical protein LEP1GSC021_4981 [Leptospira noguchii str. 1993005606]|nr:hypothetical protein LEP1GSC021_4981 [Leptospira noguchii str. 1993005606]
MQSSAMIKINKNSFTWTSHIIKTPILFLILEFLLQSISKRENILYLFIRKINLPIDNF